MILVYGTASSGKSDVAENIAVKKYQNEKINDKSLQLIYLATMETSSEASKKRISRHREKRFGKGFITVEEMYKPLSKEAEIKGNVVLLECLSNLCANVMYEKYGDDEISEVEINALSSDIAGELFALSEIAKKLVIVSNDIFSDGVKYDKWTDNYLKLLAGVNRLIADKCDEVIEVINGCEVYIK